MLTLDKCFIINDVFAFGRLVRASLVVLMGRGAPELKRDRSRVKDNYCLKQFAQKNAIIGNCAFCKMYGRKLCVA